MAKANKRYAAVAEKIDPDNFYPMADAFSLAKQTATAKFDEGVDVLFKIDFQTFELS